MEIKKLNSLILLLALSISGTVAAQNTMFIKETSTAVTSYPLTNISKLTFSSGNMNVHQSDGDTTLFPLNNVSRYTFAYVPVSIKEIKDEEISGLFAFPNPGNNEVKLSYKSIDTRTTKIEIVDMKGNVIYKQEEKSVKGKNTISIDVSKFTQGLYVFRVYNDYDVETIKFLKN